ncbi:TetR/AcrR family transcriptional regulator [Trujillonella endophytica]|uniref:Transcriptional regulator, TetR family n=1 Tax=Trujillonella endophytica TaxID=673521 RepID=A0A1H8PGQ0_9ACTN|nr:TetR/AcrR family transcriptional regulator [Trujillella endophytica]SEO41095.1 transcriptional regulator, TetR family [Trujillella endophytica]
MTEPPPARDELGTRALGRPPNADAAATRRAILAAASAQLASVGYAGMNLHTVAADAGITRAAIYRYFESKRELARAAVLESPTSYEEKIARYVVAEDGVLEQVRALVHAVVSHAFQDRQSSLQYFELARLAQHDEEIAAVYRARSLGLRQVTEDIVRRGIEAGEVSPDADPSTVVDAISGLLWSLGAGASEAPNDTVRRQVLLATDLLLQAPPWLARDRPPQT